MKLILALPLFFIANAMGYVGDVDKTTTTSCTAVDMDAWGTGQLVPCCDGLEQCTEPRPTSSPYYSQYPTIEMCRNSCDSGDTPVGGACEVDNFKERFEGIEGRVDEIYTQIGILAIKAEVGDIKAKVGEILDDVGAQGGDIAAIKADVGEIKVQVGEIMKLVESIASEATAKPTAKPTTAKPTTPAPAGAPELNGCGEPCADVVTLDQLPDQFSDVEIKANTCYVVDGTFPSSHIVVPVLENCVKITIPEGSSLEYVDVRGDSAEVYNAGEVGAINAYGCCALITNTGIGPLGTGTYQKSGFVNINDNSNDPYTQYITVSFPGKAIVYAQGYWPAYGKKDIIFNCYGVDVTVQGGTDRECSGN